LRSSLPSPISPLPSPLSPLPLLPSPLFSSPPFVFHANAFTLDSSCLLTELGADSVALAHLVRGIHERFGVKLTLPSLVRLPSLFHLQLVIFSGDHGVSELLQVTTNNTSDFWLSEVEHVWKVSRKPRENADHIHPSISGYTLTSTFTSYLR
jgi:hypothetical protein